MLAQFNWVDWVILAVIIYYVIDGWETGLAALLVNLASFLGSLWLSIKYHGLVGNFLVEKFGLSTLWSNVAGYLFVAIVSEMVLSEVGSLILARLPKKLLVSRANQWLGAVVSAINSLVLIAFFLLLILALPLRGAIKQDIRSSQLASFLVRFAERYGGSVRSSLDEAAQQAIKFLTIEPQSTERIALDIAPKSSDLAYDPAAEATMVVLVNGERAKVGAPELRVDPAMTAVARAHSMDMFLRHYFSHIDPDGHDPAYRMEQGGVSFTVIGENLAYAPDVYTAHTGLMNSPEHRRNILDPEFHRLGIGIVNGGIWGEMFTQEFTN